MKDKIENITVKYSTNKDDFMAYNLTHAVKNKTKLWFSKPFDELRLLNEIINIMIMDDDVEAPVEIIVRVNIAEYVNECSETKIVQKELVKHVSGKRNYTFSYSYLIEDLSDFIFNLDWCIQALEHYTKIQNQQIEFRDVNK